jgi:hypothetical protein
MLLLDAETALPRRHLHVAVLYYRATEYWRRSAILDGISLTALGFTMYNYAAPIAAAMNSQQRTGHPSGAG